MNNMNAFMPAGYGDGLILLSPIWALIVVLVSVYVVNGVRSLL